MKFSNFEHLERWEGLRLTAYKDSGGILTIGYGHTGPDVYAGQVITLATAKALAAIDIAEAEHAVNSGVKVAINQNEFDAFVSLAYNIGNAAFLGSTALARFNAGNKAGAAEAILWWNKVGKRVIQGLVNRRAAEKALFLTPVATIPETKTKELEALFDEFLNRAKEIVNG